MARSEKLENTDVSIDACKIVLRLRVGVCAVNYREMDVGSQECVRRRSEEICVPGSLDLCIDPLLIQLL